MFNSANATTIIKIKGSNFAVGTEKGVYVVDIENEQEKLQLSNN